MRRWGDVALLRAACVLLVLLAATLAWPSFRTAILEWRYMAMGLRRTAVFAGLCLVVFGRNTPWVRRAKPLLFALPIAYLLYVYHNYSG
jgi:hypothetical protein